MMSIKRSNPSHKQKNILQPPKKFAVFLLNDDFTTMDFVVEVLMSIFYFDENRATITMLRIHHTGRGLCGVFSKDIAQTKQRQVLTLAQQEGFPLQCIIEEQQA